MVSILEGEGIGHGSFDVIMLTVEKGIGTSGKTLMMGESFSKPTPISSKWDLACPSNGTVFSLLVEVFGLQKLNWLTVTIWP